MILCIMALEAIISLDVCRINKVRYFVEASHTRASIQDSTSRNLEHLGSLPPNPLDKIRLHPFILSIKYS